MLERSEASKISKPVISTTARRRRVVEGFARKNLKNHEIVMPAVGAGSAHPNCLMCKGLMCSYSFKVLP